jgi:hypothetical protein
MEKVIRLVASSAQERGALEFALQEMFEQLSPVVGGLYTSYGGKSTLICGMLMDMGYANNKTWIWVWSFHMLESCSRWEI